MEWVASQPQPPPRSRTSTARLANFLNPLRKSPSSRDLQQASAGYIAYSTPSSYVSSSHLSSSISSSPSTNHGFTTNKARLGRAFAEGSGKSRDDSAFFIPYKGPISPPSAYSSSFGHPLDSDKTLTDRSVYLQLDRDGRAITQEKPLSIKALYDSDSTIAAAATNTKVLNDGLPSAYSHGGNTASDQNVPMRSIGYQSYLPSSMRFDVSDKDDRFSSLGKGALAPSQTRYQRFSIRPFVSPQTSPALPSMNSKAFPSLDAKAASVTSSEGNASSIIHEDSVSTSMTSLRGDLTVNGSKGRQSHDAPLVNMSARQRPKANTASVSSLRGAAKADENVDLNHDTRVISTRSTNNTDQGSSQTSVAFPRLPVIVKEEAVQTDPSNESHQEVTPKPSLRNDLQEAKEKYETLQKLHREEVKSQAPDQSGWLEPNSNCEKILLPRPTLRGSRIEGYESDQDRNVRKDEEVAAAFERYRSSKAIKSSPQISDSSRAQEIISQPVYDGAQTQGDKRVSNATPLFHHRMPPPIPDDNIKTERQSSRPDNVQIPPRRSSQTRKRRTMQSRTQSRATTAPKVSFQDHDVDTLDLATVLAQGRALEEERAKWREQYRRSVGRARSTGTITPEQRKELAELRRVRYGDEVMPELTSDTSRRGRSASSDTNRNVVRRSRSSPNINSSQSERVRDEAPVCIDLHMSAPFHSRTAPKNKGNHLRRRSQSSGNLAASFNCLPKLYRRQRSTTMLPSSKDKIQTKEVPPMPVPSVAKDTQVISRQSNLTEARTSPGLGQGPYTYKYPRSPDPSSDAYGIAFSAPRPDIGHSSAPIDPTFLAGRHATKYEYPHPLNHQNGALGRPAVIRNDSLGMNQIGKSLNRERQDGSSPDLDHNPTSTLSLPVPPRRRRSSQTNSSQPTPKEEQGYFDPPVQGNRMQANAFYTPGDDFNTPAAFFTPELAPILTLDNTNDHQERNPISPDTQSRRSEKTERGRSEVSRSHRSIDQGTFVSSDDSSYSPRSIPARELWNTDVHSEEAFTGLFFRRPGVFTERDRSMSDATVKPGSDIASNNISHRILDEAPPRKSKESMYRSSLHGKRDSREVQKMVGSYIDSISDDGSYDDDSLQREPAWNDSTTNVYRQETLRIGRVGDRKPEVQPAYQHDADLLEAGHDDSIGLASTRGRQGSFAASLLMAVDSPDQRHHQDQFEQNDDDHEDEPRISDVSLANMVRDYMWPDPPAEQRAI